MDINKGKNSQFVGEITFKASLPIYVSRALSLATTGNLLMILMHKPSSSSIPDFHLETVKLQARPAFRIGPEFSDAPGYRQ